MQKTKTVKPTGSYKKAYARVQQNAKQLKAHKGPYYERWLAGMNQFIKGQTQI